MKIEALKDEIDDFIGALSKKSGFFTSKSRIPLALGHLKISPKMNLKDLLETIARLENLIDIKEENRIDPSHFELFNVTPPAISSAIKQEISKKAGLVKLLQKTHTLLLDHYDKGFKKSFSSSNEVTHDEKDYNDDHLKASQPLQELSISTRLSGPSISEEENYGSFFDSKRKGLMIKGRLYQDLNAFKEAIENFTNDKISTFENKNNYFSKADLIFYEGGQGLHAICLQELSNSLDLMAAGEGDSTINWQEKNGIIYAEVSEKYMTILKNDTSKMYVLGSDTETLVPIEIDEQPNYTRHSDPNTLSPIVPILTVTARFDIVKNADNEGYHLEATAYKLTSNTPYVLLPGNENAPRP